MMGFMEAPLTVRERLRLLELAESAQNYEVRQHALALLKAEEKPPMAITKEQAERLVQIGIDR